MTVIPASGINFGFTGADIWNNAMLIVSSLGTFVVIGLAIAFAPRIIGVLKRLFGGRA